MSASSSTKADNETSSQSDSGVSRRRRKCRCARWNRRNAGHAASRRISGALHAGGPSTAFFDSDAYRLTPEVHDIFAAGKAIRTRAENFLRSIAEPLDIRDRSVLRRISRASGATLRSPVFRRSP